MNTSRFYTMRSCNDDYVPIKLENCVPDPRLEEIDAKIDALYNEEITMEATLSEPEWYVRPDFDEENNPSVIYHLGFLGSGIGRVVEIRTQIENKIYIFRPYQ